ncbi:MAG: ABC transporter permease [Desulfurococcales archaeon]|nr:ABC transporter permease [Desulfurococcales archaeon]
MSRRVLRAYTWAVIALLYIPLILTIIYSFSNARYFGEWGGFTLRWYKLMLSDPELWRAATNSLVVAALSAVISVLLALPLALSLPGKARAAAEALIYPPLIIPEITEAVALMTFFVWIGFPLGMVSVLIGHTAFNVAYAYLVLKPGTHGVRRLEEAARSLGATRLQAVALVVAPVLLPTILAAGALAFIMSFTDFTKTLFTAGPGFDTLTVLIWNRARRPGLTPYTSQPYLAAITSVLLLASIAVLAVWLVKRGEASRGA